MKNLAIETEHKPDDRAGQHLDDFQKLLVSTKVSDRQGRSIELREALPMAGEMLLESARRGVIILLGNGGSAAITTHMQADLFLRLGARAVSFGDTPCLTALANDYGYREAYQRLVEVWADGNSLMVGVSSSGQSHNILNGVRMAKSKGSVALTFSGFSPQNPLRTLGDLNFYVASQHYGLVEGVHGVLSHTIIDLVTT